MLKRMEDQFIAKLEDPNDRQILLRQYRRGLTCQFAVSCLIGVLMLVGVVFQLRSGNSDSFSVLPLFIFLLISMFVGLILEIRIYFVRIVDMLISRESELRNE